MKHLFLLLAFTLNLFAYETGASNSVLRVPNAGGRPIFGAVDLSKSPAVTGILPPENGGRGSSTLEITNASLAASVSGNALTIALKGADGSDPSSTNTVYIGTRNATAATGTYNQRSVTSALSVVIPSATTIGTVSAVPSTVYVYAIDNGGTIALGVSLQLFDDGSIQSSTAISGGSSATVLYSTSALSSKAVRLLGRVKITEATAGTWATSPSEVANVPFNKSAVSTYSAATSSGSASGSGGFVSGTYTTPAGVKQIIVRMVGGGGGGAAGQENGVSGSNGGAGGSTTFGSLTAGGGSGGSAGAGGSGGSPSGSYTMGVAGCTGSGGGYIPAAFSGLLVQGGNGCNSALGGAGTSTTNATGNAAAANTGSGGAGGGSAGTGSISVSGGGGGSGAYIMAIITNPAATYSYSVGAAGAAGTVGSGHAAGGAGGLGGIWVEEIYQ